VPQVDSAFASRDGHQAMSEPILLARFFPFRHTALFLWYTVRPFCCKANGLRSKRLAFKVVLSRGESLKSRFYLAFVRPSWADAPLTVLYVELSCKCISHFRLVKASIAKIRKLFSIYLAMIVRTEHIYTFILAISHGGMNLFSRFPRASRCAVAPTRSMSLLKCCRHPHISAK